MTDAHSAAEPVRTTDADTLCINTIRTLAMDAIQAAHSGHPGTPMALAPVGYLVRRPACMRWIPNTSCSASLPSAWTTSVNFAPARVIPGPPGVPVHLGRRDDDGPARAERADQCWDGRRRLAGHTAQPAWSHDLRLRRVHVAR